MRILLGPAAPQCSQLSIDDHAAPAVVERIAEGRSVTLGALLADPSERTQRLSWMSLALRQDEADRLLSEDRSEFALRDQILFVGTAKARAKQELIARNLNVLEYALTGLEASGWLWRHLSVPHRGTSS